MLPTGPVVQRPIEIAERFSAAARGNVSVRSTSPGRRHPSRGGRPTARARGDSRGDCRAPARSSSPGYRPTLGGVAGASTSPAAGSLGRGVVICCVEGTTRGPPATRPPFRIPSSRGAAARRQPAVSRAAASRRAATGGPSKARARPRPEPLEHGAVEPAQCRHLGHTLTDMSSRTCNSRSRGCGSGASSRCTRTSPTIPRPGLAVSACGVADRGHRRGRLRPRTARG